MKNAVRPGSIISFYGTQHIVESVGSAKNDDIKDTVRVNIGGGASLNLWWTDRAGCTIIKF